MKFFRKIITVILVGFLFSCSSNLDFEQVNQIEAEPVFNISLGFFNISPTDFSGVGVSPVPSVNEDIEYRIFENQLLSDNLNRLEYTIGITNTFNRAFVFSFRFLDENGGDTFISESYSVDANSAISEEILIYDKNSLNNNIRQTKSLRLELSFEDPSEPLSPSTTGTFQFKSSTTVYLKTSINNQ
jgi:hypothetical protein